MKLYKFIIIILLSTTIYGKLTPISSCGQDPNCQEVNSSRPYLPKATLDQVDKYISIVMEEIIFQNSLDYELIYTIENILLQASEDTFYRNICLDCLELKFLAKEDNLYKSLHEWLEKQIIISYPSFFQKFHRWISDNISTRLRNLSEEDKQQIKKQLMAQYEEVPFCYRASITSNDIEIQIAINESEDDTFSNLKRLWGKNEWFTILCGLNSNQIQQLLKTNNSLITYLNNKCEEMLEED